MSSNHRSGTHRCPGSIRPCGPWHTMLLQQGQTPQPAAYYAIAHRVRPHSLIHAGTPATAHHRHAVRHDDRRCTAAQADNHLHSKELKKLKSVNQFTFVVTFSSKRIDFHIFAKSLKHQGLSPLTEIWRKLNKTFYCWQPTPHSKRDGQ